MIKEIKDNDLKKHITRKILRDLPEWFGIEEYTEDYIEKSADYPFFAAYDDDLPAGFVYIKETSPFTIEIYCMGVLKKYHRKGYGKRLMDYISIYAKKKNYKFIQVKTVKQGIYDTYDKTNKFYRDSGFYELEVFPDLWDKHNPCQVFVKSVK